MRVIDIGGNYTKNGQQIFSRLEVQRLLNISNRGTIRRQLKAIHIDPDDLNYKFTWEHIRLLLAMRLFLIQARGKHTREMFTQILDNGLLEEMCREFQINLDIELEKLKDDYYQQKEQTAA